MQAPCLYACSPWNSLSLCAKQMYSFFKPQFKCYLSEKASWTPSRLPCHFPGDLTWASGHIFKGITLLFDDTFLPPPFKFHERRDHVLLFFIPSILDSAKHRSPVHMVEWMNEWDIDVLSSGKMNSSVSRHDSDFKDSIWVNKAMFLVVQLV